MASDKVTAADTDSATVFFHHMRPAQVGGAMDPEDLKGEGNCGAAKDIPPNTAKSMASVSR